MGCLRSALINRRPYVCVVQHLGQQHSHPHQTPPVIGTSESAQSYTDSDVGTTHSPINIPTTSVAGEDKQSPPSDDTARKIAGVVVGLGGLALFLLACLVYRRRTRTKRARRPASPARETEPAVPVSGVTCKRRQMAGADIGVSNVIPAGQTVARTMRKQDSQSAPGRRRGLVRIATTPSGIPWFNLSKLLRSPRTKRCRVEKMFSYVGIRKRLCLGKST